MKSYAVSGAGGLVGGGVVSALLERGYCRVTAITGSPSKTALRFSDERLNVVSNEGFLESAQTVDVLVHCAFSRKPDADELAASLKLTELLANSGRARRLVYISSQGVYGSFPRGYFAAETVEPAPRDPYAAAKLEGEGLVKGKASAVCIRLASVVQNCGFMRVFAGRVKSGQAITLTAPNQIVSLIDLRDAVGGILTLADASELSGVYNLGIGKQYTILECAEAILRVGQELGFCDGKIEIDDAGSTLAMGIDPTKLIHDCGWRPQYGLDDMAREVFSCV